MASASTSAGQYFVLIFDCEGDGQVKSAILERRAALDKAGYKLVLGLRDLYPEPLSNLSKITRGLAYGVPTSGVPIRILLAVAEVEAWFLQEHSHFIAIHPSLSTAEIRRIAGFDPVCESAESIANPAATLHNIYSSVGLAYRKKRRHVSRTVSVLDYTSMYIDLPQKLPHLRDLVGQLDKFFCH